MLLRLEAVALEPGQTRQFSDSKSLSKVQQENSIISLVHSHHIRTHISQKKGMYVSTIQTRPTQSHGDLATIQTRPTQSHGDLVQSN